MKAKTKERMEDELNQLVLNSVQKILGNNLHCITLFGSRARGDFAHDSDYDFFIITKHETMFGQDRSIYYSLSDYELDKGLVVCLHFEQKQSFEKLLPVLPYYQNIRKEGILLYGSW